jgi:hypothetical protein
VPEANRQHLRRAGALARGQGPDRGFPPRIRAHRGGKTGTRYFCKTCGILCFLRGHLDVLGGDYVSINLNTLDEVELTNVKVEYWDGRHDNWMAGSRAVPWPMFA